jgi:ribosomal-protein-alanine N-acetyltransferase
MYVMMTSRLMLQPFSHALMQALMDSRESFMQWSQLDLADDWPNLDLFEALPFIAKTVGAQPALEEWSRLLVLPSKGRDGRGLVIGEVGFKGLPDSDGAVEIGYGLARSHRQLGYTTEAVRAMCAWARAQHGVKLIRAECFATNAGSIGVLRHAGFIERNSDDQMLRWELQT